MQTPFLLKVRRGCMAVTAAIMFMNLAWTVWQVPTGFQHKIWSNLTTNAESAN